MVNCAIELVEFIVIAFNLLCWLLGLVLMIVGVYYYLAIQTYYDLTYDNFTVIPILAICVGTAVFVIASLGCRGASRKSECMLLTYAGLLSTLFVAQLSLSIAGYVQVQQHDGDLNTTFVPEVYAAFKLYGNSSHVRTIFNTVQIVFTCCGVQSFEDYDNYALALPGTCCANVPTVSLCSPDEAYPEGCATKLFDMVLGHIEILAYVALAIATIELLCAMSAALLIYTIRKEKARDGFDMSVDYLTEVDSEWELHKFV